MNSQKRPLSPHIQIYSPQIPSVLSITHRLTGVFLFVGALLLASWIIAATYGPKVFNQASLFLNSWFGSLILIGLTVSFFYHLGNGLRHLCWDLGKGFELKSLRFSGWVVIGFSIIMTLAVCLIVFSGLEGR